MKILDHLYGFIWNDPRVNNCNTYFIDGPPRILVDPGHSHLFGKVEGELSRLGLRPEDMEVVVATHAHPDHLEALFRFKEPTVTAMGHQEYIFFKDLARQVGWNSAGEDPEPGLFLENGNLKIGGLNFQVLLSPGIPRVPSASIGKTAGSCFPVTSSSIRDWGERTCRVETESS